MSGSPRDIFFKVLGVSEAVARLAWPIGIPRPAGEEVDLLQAGGRVTAKAVPAG